MSKIWLNPLRLLLLSLLSVTLLSGCGFKLRGSHQIPDSLKVMHLQLDDIHAELGKLLRKQLVINEIELVKPNNLKNQNIATLQLFEDKLDRRTLSLFPNGQVAEYELIYTVRYAISFPEQDPQYFEFELYRDYQDAPQSALAKSKELKLILQEMRQQASDTIVRRLASFTRKANS